MTTSTKNKDGNDRPSEDAFDAFLGFPASPLTAQEAIEQRHSVRSYKDVPLNDHVIESLQQAIAQVNEEGALDIQLVLNEPRAFAGFKSKLAKFSGVQNYLVLVGPEYKYLDVELGYYGEKLVLYAQALGLNSCWVGATYKVVNRSYRVQLGQKLSAVIALGYGETQGVPHVSKSPEQICSDYHAMPEWFQRGVDAALLAPSALNQQKFSFALEKEEVDDLPVVNATTKRGSFTKMDLGIAKCHFEIGADRAPFMWHD